MPVTFGDAQTPGRLRIIAQWEFDLFSQKVSLPHKNPLQNRNRTAQWTHIMKEGKVTSPSCLVSCIALFLLALPTPISGEVGTAPAPHEHSSQWEGKPQAGREKGAHYFRGHLTKIFKGRVWHREAGFPRDCFIWKKLSLTDREDHFRATFSSSSPSTGSGMAGWVNVALTFCRCYFKSKIIHRVKRQALWVPSESVI